MATRSRLSAAVPGLLIVVLLGLLAAPVACGGGAQNDATLSQGTDTGMSPVVLELKALVERNGWQDMFAEAIANAQAQNVPTIADVQGMEILNRLGEFYFFLQQEPVLSLQNEITPADQSPELTELSAWMVEYAKAWGTFLDTPESITAESLQTFYDSPMFRMDDYMQMPGGWRTFNQFFARHVRPGARPIEALNDDSVIVAAADSTFVGAWPIDEDSRITVKGVNWSVLELLEGSEYADRFEGGTFTHAFLSTTDYHRLHVPVGGEVLESRVILGQVYLDVLAVADEATGTTRIETVRHLDVQDATGYQFAQARGLIVIDSPVGLVAVLPIGMAQVSSVIMTADVGRTLHKGEEFSYFQFGGSDHIMVFEAGANVTITAQVGEHYNQGVKVGEAR